MKDLIKTIIKLKNKANMEWLNVGIPLHMVETLAAHVLSDIILILTLSKAVGCDARAAIILALQADLSDEPCVHDGISHISNKNGEKTKEMILAALAHELSLTIQAKNYLRLGYEVEEPLKKHIATALELTAKLDNEALAQIIHEILMSL